VNTTTVVHIPERYDVYIGRAGQGQDGYFGNPYKLQYMSREESIKRYVTYFYNRIKNDAEFKARILELKGKRLGCFCTPEKCHGDIIVKYLSMQGETQ
jgi:hypothetical protein